MSPPSTKKATTRYAAERKACENLFQRWGDNDQVNFLKELLTSMTYNQQRQVKDYIKPLVHQNMISLLVLNGLNHIVDNMFSYFDKETLENTELVCKDWRNIVTDRKLWKKLLQRTAKNDLLWRHLLQRRGWSGRENGVSDETYKNLFHNVMLDLARLEENWRTGTFSEQIIIPCWKYLVQVRCIHSDHQKIVAGLEDSTIRVWNRKSLQWTLTMRGHTGAVLHLQVDHEKIVSCSADTTVRVWNVYTGSLMRTVQYHWAAVLYAQFKGTTMVTCSKDRIVGLWNFISPTQITLRKILLGHQDDVNMIQFDDVYIVSASKDKTLKVWNTSTGNFISTLSGHTNSVECLRYMSNIAVSGSSDQIIRIWNIPSSVCLRVLVGHEGLVQCVQFDWKRIVSASRDGTIKIWDLRAALDTSVYNSALCLTTMKRVMESIFTFKQDDFEIVSGSLDGTIRIWNFLMSSRDTPTTTGGGSDAGGS